MDIKEVIDNYGLSIAEAARILDIPYRTMQNWVNGSRKPAKYMAFLIDAGLHEKNRQKAIQIYFSRPRM